LTFLLKISLRNFPIFFISPPNKIHIDQ
jgi:hypothetical protein